MNLPQIATGNYASLEGTWSEEAYAVNPQNGTGFQWMPGGTDTLAITNGDIVNATQGMEIQGLALTYKSNPMALSFQVNSNYAEATLVNQDVGTNWALDFYPTGSAGLASNLHPNNGVTLDNSKNTIYIFTSDSYMQVFSQTQGSFSPSSTTPSTSATSTTIAASAPCAASAITAAVKTYLASQGIGFLSLDQYGCAGGFAYAYVSVSIGSGVEVNYVLTAQGTQWVAMERDPACENGSLPEAVRHPACDSD